MSDRASKASGGAGDDALAAEVARMIEDRFPGRTLARLERRPHAYRTSFPLEELDVVLDDGGSMRLMLKDASRESLGPEALNAKPAFLHDPVREIETYRRILDSGQLGTPAFYGASVDPQHERYWLLIENVEGDVLWQLGEHEIWQEVARWLAGMHRRFEGRLDEGWSHLLRYDAAFYRVWIERALGFARGDPERHARLAWLAARYERVIERLAALPVTFIHGELYPSNVMIAERGGSLRVCPIDWELAAVGPGAIDLAALITGSWEDDERSALVEAYATAGGGGRAAAASELRELNQTLDYCRLHLAVQWLGWEPGWSPPAEHRQDWLATIP